MREGGMQSLKRWVFSPRLNVDSVSAVLTSTAVGPEQRAVVNEPCRCDGRGVNTRPGNGTRNTERSPVPCPFKRRCRQVAARLARSGQRQANGEGGGGGFNWSRDRWRTAWVAHAPLRPLPGGSAGRLPEPWARWGGGGMGGRTPADGGITLREPPPPPASRLSSRAAFGGAAEGRGGREGAVGTADP